MGTDQQWELHGARDPYWAVLTDARYHRATMGDAAREAFFASGQERIAYLLGQADTAFGAQDAYASALDFGCGVGRLSIPLSRVCERVVGIDVSSSMLAEAARNASDMGIQNLEWVRSGAGLAELSGRSFDLIVSDIVFQHIPVRRGMQLYRGLLELLGPGGRGILGFTYDKRHRLARLRQAVKRLPGAQPAFDAAWRFAKGTPPMQMNTYPLGGLIRELQLRGVQRIQALLGEHEGTLSAGLLFELPGRR